MKLVLVAALITATSVAAADTSADDDAFRASARAFAKRTNRRVVAWGTARLDGAKPHRFATLRATDRRELDSDIVRCSKDKVCRGAYLFEASPGTAKLWLVSFDEDRMPTKPFVVKLDVPAGEPAWVQLDDKGITHDQLHIGGWQSQTFGLRGGKLVMLRIFDEDRRNNGWDDRTFTSSDGIACKRACPALASFAYAISDRSRLQIVGPDREDRLVEAPQPD